MSDSAPKEDVGSAAGASWLEAFEDLRARTPTERRVELVRVAQATRRVIEALISAKIPAGEISHAAELIEQAATVIEGYPRIRGFAGFSESANAGDVSFFFDRSPIIGRENPIAPPLSFAPIQGPDGEVTIEGTGSFGSAYEGPPKCVHGGYLAAAFDEVCGMAQSLSGSPGMTAKLIVNYRRPTPLHAELRFVGRLLAVEGRKIYTEGKCYFGDVLTAEAEALFISVDFSKITPPSDFDTSSKH